MAVGTSAGIRSGPAARGRAARVLVVFVLVLGTLGATTGDSTSERVRAEEPGTPAGSGDGRTVGWETYRSLDELGGLRHGGNSKQFSSFARSGSNDDGFNGTHSCLRTTERGCVIAEHTGSGEITSIWFTRDPWGDVTATGDIHIRLDGRTVLDAPLADVVAGELGPPFVWPLVGDARDTSGGAVVKVPMPYRESMRITVDENPYFYHVDYRSFADADGVTTFDPRDPALDVVRRLRRFGVADPKPDAPTIAERRSRFSLRPGESTTLKPIRGPAMIDELRLRLPGVVAAPRVIDDGRAFGAGGSSSFDARIAPGNDGVRITRRYDANVGGQVARVLVGDERVGTWNSGPARQGEWGRERVTVPAPLTRGRTELRVTNEFRSAEVDINEFRYEVHSRVDGDWIRTDVLDVGPANPGDEAAHDYRIDNQVFQRRKLVAHLPHERARVEKSDAVLRDVRLRITFDGRTTVDAPIGEFFGSGLGEYDVRRLMSSIDAGEGWYTSWWPMPFARRAEIELVNEGSVPIRRAVLEATAAPSAGAGPGTGSGHFHATHRQGLTEPGKDWKFLSTSGSGTFYGVTHTMRGRIPPGMARTPQGPRSSASPRANQRNYLEGDERFYVDGSASPAWYGTGTEDFYESGWYFRGGTTFAMPLAGNPAYEYSGDGCRYDCTGTYRLLVSDAVSFDSEIVAGIEHGPANNEPARYSSTAYWYGNPVSTMRRTDRIDLGDRFSRLAHDYNALGESRRELTATFEGRRDPGPYRYTTTSTTGEIGFRVRIDPDNSGVRLRRLADQRSSHQRVRVLVNGRDAGIWSQPLGNSAHRWLEDGFDIPAELTRDRNTLRVRLLPADDAPPWSAVRYTAFSYRTAGE
ncbi:Protein of unknown function [Actinopolyspora lacussalsi subsp. righensis]|uniref:DUF2961 domain-containing protein n=1 Tax=Actinopolyspora righensis TaxID=995060 RepID=A0A1I7BBP1_9ACTN|nr:glycoside hydrolase family 172 protein [Actinopolyspora righensis]SFT84616.1 Protein of unknown function [Actinopolyspora righensis]